MSEPQERHFTFHAPKTAPTYFEFNGPEPEPVGRLRRLWLWLRCLFHLPYRRSWIRFAPIEIPAGASITEAVLTITDREGWSGSSIGLHVDEG